MRRCDAADGNSEYTSVPLRKNRADDVVMINVNVSFAAYVPDATTVLFTTTL